MHFSFPFLKNMRGTRFSVYEFNFGDKPSARSIEHLSVEDLDAIGADTVRLSMNALSTDSLF
jgi:hypothetical protein